MIASFTELLNKNARIFSRCETLTKQQYKYLKYASKNIHKRNRARAILSPPELGRGAYIRSFCEDMVTAILHYTQRHILHISIDSFGELE
uniref:Uncharacterized protein n=1 Tax=Pararge aegeria TaxID=116150 RepID=S4PW32_9NEOP